LPFVPVVGSFDETGISGQAALDNLSAEAILTEPEKIVWQFPARHFGKTAVPETFKLMC
jgi:hypothetical protein